MYRDRDELIRRKIHFKMQEEDLRSKGLNRSQVVHELSKKYFYSPRTVYRILDEPLTDKKDLESAERLLQKYYNAGHMTIEILMRNLFKK